MIFRLSAIKDNKGAHKRKNRRGRGSGSGSGKTAGRGVKGQSSRSGASTGGFEGGQMPLYRRLPKRGFRGMEKDYQCINLSQIGHAISSGKLNVEEIITEDRLFECGLLSKRRHFAKILGIGDAIPGVKLYVARASRGAIDKISLTGGSITLYSAEIVTGHAVRGIQPNIFENNMHYEIITKTINNQFRLCIVFNISASEYSTQDIENLELVINSEAYGIRDRVLNVGKDIYKNNGKYLEYMIDEASRSRTVSADLDLLLLYRNSMIEKRRIHIDKYGEPSLS